MVHLQLWNRQNQEQEMPQNKTNSVKHEQNQKMEKSVSVVSQR